MTDLFPVNGDLEGAYMKQIKLFFSLFILCLCPIGCDEGMIDPMQLADIVSHYDTVVQTGIPDDVLAAMKITADEMSKIVKIRMADTTGRTDIIELQNQLRAKGLVDADFHAMQKAYYTRYIDAAGIAIVGPETVADEDFIHARDAIVVMTSKHPELRDRLLSKHAKFYMILVAYWENMANIPEKQLNTALLNDDPRDDWLAASCKTITRPEMLYVIGYCYAPAWLKPKPVELKLQPVRTFVHEFAHALESEMERLKPGFEEKLAKYYEHAPGVWWEYWAHGVEIWFYTIRPGSNYDTYEDFFDENPFLAEMLDEWFPRISLANDYVPLIVSPDIAEQAYTIFEQYCFECHGENGTFKNELLIDDSDGLVRDGVIIPADSIGSVLYNRLLGATDNGSQMPLRRPPLLDKDIEIIRKWIDAAAPEW